MKKTILIIIFSLYFFNGESQSLIFEDESIYVKVVESKIRNDSVLFYFTIHNKLKESIFLPKENQFYISKSVDDSLVTIFIGDTQFGESDIRLEEIGANQYLDGEKSFRVEVSKNLYKRLILKYLKLGKTKKYFKTEGKIKICDSEVYESHAKWFEFYYLTINKP